MEKDNTLKEISNKLFEIFYVDNLKYGRQQKDGSYKLVKGIITPVTIENMLEKQESLLTYQELHIVDNTLVKWICIDLDISKKEIDNNEVNENNLKAVKKTADLVSDFLDSKKIPHLIECSGRRGFHIWVIFDRLITKENAYYFANYIYSKVKDDFEENIIADLFPKIPYTNRNSKGIGYGIKLPLSQNKVSGKLSFFINRDEDFEFNKDNWIEKAHPEFLEKQLEILSRGTTVSIKQIEPYIKEYSEKSIYFHSFIKKQKIVSRLPQNIELEDILQSLRKCENLNIILKDYEKGLGNKERSILVGLLGQLSTADDPDFGKNILLELFSKIKGYNEEITLRKIETYRYFKPITCKSLGHCSTCKESSINSPVELIEGVHLEALPSFSIENIDENIFNKIQKSLVNYSFKNDEVPLFPQLELIKNIEFDEIKKYISQIYTNESELNVDSFKFQRNEINKIRDLYNIDPINNLISVYFTFVLNNLFFSEISNNSYGYEFSNSFYKDNIFNNWFINWAKYTKSVENILFGKEYEDYFVIKLDIKSFYDRVDLKRLKIKLFEEAPSAIKNKLNELDEGNVSKYKSIIDYLINLSEKTTGNADKGLPQGPAFARYLAEIYLLGLDSLIENKFITDQKREFYNRFVDDIFIFVESEDRADDLFKNIKEWLSINGLEFNNEKTKIINVKEYKESGEYHKFKDNVKYDISYASKNKSLLSEVEIQEAISKLENLTEDIKFGLKDNLRFFYSQFSDNKRLNTIRKKMADILPFSDDGRGTLYLMFYSNLISNFPEQFWNIINQIDRVKGLSLTHYLNIILSNEELYLSKTTEIDILIKSIYHREDLSDADKLLITLLSLKTNNQTLLNYTDKIMYSALQFPGLELTINHWDLTQNRLRDLDNKNFLIELEQIILKQNFTKGFLNSLAHYSFLRFSQWKVENNTAFLKKELELKQYYQSITFLTLFCESDYANVGPSWELLLEASSELGKFSDNKHQFHWINKIEKFQYTDFSKNSYTLILSNRPGANLGNNTCENEFLEQYRNLLIVLLFDKDKASGTEHFKNDVLTNINANDSLFFNWISNNNVRLYPDMDDICLKNIALNGLIVLKNENTFFVKDIYDGSITSKYNYLKVDEKYQSRNEIEYEVIPERIKDILKKSNFNEFIKSFNEIIIAHEKFKKDYNSGSPYFYNPFDSISSYPAVPFYSDYENIVNSDGEVVSVNVFSYWSGMIEILKITELADIKLVNDNSKFNFKVRDINERFFPISALLINSEESKINFVKSFVSNIHSDIDTIFQYQYNWSVTVLKLSQKLVNSNDLIINYLKIHFETYSDDNIAIDLLFSIDENLIPKKNTLDDFHNTILSSINIFQNQIQQGEIDFSEIINNHIPDILDGDSEENESIKKTELINSKLKIEENKDPFSKHTIYKLIINDIESEATEIYFFNHFSKKFQIESLEDLSSKMRGSDFFVANKESKVFIYTPEIEFSKCYERINKRKVEVYDKLFSGTATRPAEFDEYINLFPSNTNYSMVKEIVDGLSELDYIKIKLSYHLKNSFDITYRIINWLSLFNEESIGGSDLKKYMDEKGYNFPTLYKSILTVLNAHCYISQNHLNFFQEKITAYKNDKDCILFPIKNPLNDANGLKRLLEKSGYNERDFNWPNQFDNLCGDHNFKKLIIVTDVSISGSQTKKAFDYYLKSDYEDESKLIEFNENRPDSDKKSPKEERYFLFNTIEKCKKFQGNLSAFDQIIFLSPLMTQKYTENIKEYFKDINSNISFECEDILLEEKSYLYNKSILNKDQKELFNALIGDVELISKIFQLNKEYYKNDLSQFDKMNLILRIQSLPTKHIRLFSLQPKRGGLPLLDFIKNWKN